MTFPVMSLPDPKNEAEGGIDPLGMAFIAEHMAEAMLPGLTQRMARPRFVTLMSVGAVATADLELRAEDGTTPEIAFEWLVVQALAQVDGEIFRVPGITKARTVMSRRDAPLPENALIPRALLPSRRGAGRHRRRPPPEGCFGARAG